MTETEAAPVAATEPVIEEIPEAEANAPVEEQGEAKRSRAQKKVMKAMAKLNLRKVAGIQRVVMRNSKKGNFRIEGGEVYQVANSDTYIVFGEVETDDFLSRARSEAVNKFKQEQAAPKEQLPKIEDEAEDAENDEDVDTEGLEDKDIELVMQQAGVTKAKAAKALKSNDNDIVNAIMELTM